MKRLLVFDYLRGPDSTGLAGIRNNGDVYISKVASHPFELFDMKSFGVALSAYSSKVFLGHNRLATKGKVTSINAHPFTFDHITGAHNGTLEQESWDKLEQMLGEKFNVDSQALIAAIAKFGIEETIKNIAGAWSLVWFDASDDTLNFLRNKERPMWRAFSDDCKNIIWASEYPMIRAAIEINSSDSNKVELYVEKSKERSYSFWENNVDTWYRFKLDELKKGGDKPPKPVCKKVEGQEPKPKTVGYCGNQYGVYRDVDPFGRSSGGSTKTTTNQLMTLGGKGKSAKTTVVHLVTDNTAPFKDFVSFQRFEELSKRGCSYCSAPIDYDDEGIAIFDKQDIILCQECLGGKKEDNRLYLADLSSVL